jgi:predicted secreted hydrolase
MDRRQFQRAWLSLLGGMVPAARAVVPVIEFTPVRPGHQLAFPADHGAHPAFRTEWWYVTGWLNQPDGSKLGFQTTFFRVRTGIGEDQASAFSPRQLIMAHAAVADPALGRLRHAQRVARTGFGRAGAAVGQTRVWLDDWRLTQDDKGYHASVKCPEFAYALTLVPPGPPQLNGTNGFSVKAPDPRHASYYYSRPQLTVTGTVTLSGQLTPVTGRAWLDHEWSSELLPPGAQGWDWVGLNLDDGSALMAFRMRDPQNQPLWAVATVSPTQGTAHQLLPDEVVFEPLRNWTSTRSGITYPVAWSLRIGARRLQLHPLFDDQELDSRRSTGTIYWEGAVRVLEAEVEIGRGYLDLTGYGEKIQVG